MEWYYNEGDRKVGPLTQEELECRVHARVINIDTLVWQEGADKWRPLREFSSLRFVSEATPPKVNAPAAVGRVLTVEQLRDSNEKTALTLLFVAAVPVYLVLLVWIVFSMGILLVFFGFFYLMGLIGQHFAAAYIKTNSVRVSENQFPEIHAAVHECATTLNIAPPDVYILQHNLWNAFATKLAGKRMVVLLSGAVDSILLKGDFKQLKWVVGHEIGHHAAGHLNWTRSWAKLGGWLPWLYLWYSRRAELTCDRIALYCVGEQKSSIAALSNLAVGAQLSTRMNVPGAIADWQNYSGEFFVKYRTMYSTHPPLLARFAQLQTAAKEFGIN